MMTQKRNGKQSKCCPLYQKKRTPSVSTSTRDGASKNQTVYSKIQMIIDRCKANHTNKWLIHQNTIREEIT